MPVFLLFFAVWMILNGKVTAEICIFGVLISAALFYFMCVLKIILSPELQPEPAFVYFDTDFKTGLARVLLANSITLTPGTITVSVEDDRFCVHCLDKELAEGMETSVFVKLLKEMEEMEAKWTK